MKTKNIAGLIDQARDVHRRHGSTFKPWVSYKHKYLWTPIGKVASTATEVTLGHLETGEPPPPYPHAPGVARKYIDDAGQRLSSKNFSAEEIVDILSSPDWFKFAFVRNPYYRLFSAYKSRIMNRVAHDYGWAKEAIRKKYEYPIRDGQPDGMVSFRDFVDFVLSSTGRAHWDVHWHMQSDILLLDVVTYDFIGRLETFAEDFMYVLERLNAPADVLATGSIVRGKSVEIHHAAAYDRDLADRVYEAHKPDFEIFGYDKDSWMFDYE